MPAAPQPLAPAQARSRPPESVRESCWPNDLERLLLLSGLESAEKARGVWTEFCLQIHDDIEGLDDSSYRLFPLIALNLKPVILEIPHGRYLQSVFRHAWARSQKLLAEALPVLRAIQAEQIDFLVLKGIALSVLYYRHWGARPTNDIDILIRPRDLERTAAILFQAGYATGPQMSPRELAGHFRFRHELTFRNARGVEIDVHWHLVSEGRSEAAEDRLWNDAVPCAVLGLETRALEPADQFLHACTHGVRWNEVSPVRWLADAALIVRHGFDWNRLAQQAQAFQRIEPVKETILYLDRLGIRLPAEALSFWNRIPLSELEQLENGYRMRRPNPRQRTRQLALAYLRLYQSRSLFQLWLDLPSYMRQLHHFRAFSRRVSFVWHILSAQGRVRRKTPAS